MKKCSRCRTEKCVEEFHRNKSRKDGYQHVCKFCRRDIGAASFQRRKDKIREYWKRRREDEGGEFLAKCRKYAKTNYQRHKDAIKERQAMYSKTEAGKSVIAKSQGKRRAAVSDTDITVGWLVKLKVATVRCSKCSEWRPNHLDHIVPLCIGGKHMRNNVRFLCAHCNLTRGNCVRD